MTPVQLVRLCLCSPMQPGRHYIALKAVPSAELVMQYKVLSTYTGYVHLSHGSLLLMRDVRYTFIVLLPTQLCVQCIFEQWLNYTINHTAAGAKSITLHISEYVWSVIHRSPP